MANQLLFVMKLVTVAFFVQCHSNHATVINTEIIDTNSDLIHELKNTENMVELGNSLLDIFVNEESSNLAMVLNEAKIAIVELHGETEKILTISENIFVYKPLDDKLKNNPVAAKKWKNIELLQHLIIDHAEQLLMVRDTFLFVMNNMTTSLFSVSVDGKINIEMNSINNSAVHRLKEITKSFHELQDNTDKKIKENTINTLQYINKILYDLPGSIAFNGIKTEYFRYHDRLIELQEERTEYMTEYNRIKNGLNNKLKESQNTRLTIQENVKLYSRERTAPSTHHDRNYYSSLYNKEKKKLRQIDIEIDNLKEDMQRNTDKYNAYFERIKNEENLQIECKTRTIKQIRSTVEKLAIDFNDLFQENEHVSEGPENIISNLETMKSETNVLAQKQLLFNEMLGVLGDIIIENAETELELIKQKQIDYYLSQPLVNLSYLVDVFKGIGIHTLSEFRNRFCEKMDDKLYKLVDNIQEIMETNLTGTATRKLKWICRDPNS